MVLVTKPKRTATIHHKKRSGQHHKQSKHYAKAYWPYIPLIAIVGIGMVINGVWSSHMHGVLGDSTDISATQLLSDTNTDRANANVLPLVLNNQLTQAAQAKANDMVQQNYWSHNSPTGQTPWALIDSTGYQFAAAGENLAYGFNSTSALMNGWMNSTEHRVNILNTEFAEVGFGIAQSSNFQGHGPETIVVAEYAEPARIVTAASDDSVSSMPSVVVTAPQAASVSRAQASYSSEWGIIAISIITALALTIFLLRHGLHLKRAFAKSEEFVIHHPMLDILVAVVATLGILLTRTAGFIH